MAPAVVICPRSITCSARTSESARSKRSFRISLTRLYHVEWGCDDDLDSAVRLTQHYAALALGLVDAVVIAIAARHRASAIALELDVRHFGAVKIAGAPQLWPRDL